MYLNVKFVENPLNSRKTIMQIHVVKNVGTTNIMKTENFINGKKEFLKLYNVENSGQI